jgi:hypothetical protein
MINDIYKVGDKVLFLRKNEGYGSIEETYSVETIKAIVSYITPALRYPKKSELSKVGIRYIVFESDEITEMQNVNNINLIDRVKSGKVMGVIKKLSENEYQHSYIWD